MAVDATRVWPFIKANRCSLFTCLIFVTAVILAIVALSQHLRPIDTIITSQQRILEVTVTDGMRAILEESIASLSQARSLILLLYIAVIIFLLYMTAVRILKLFDRQMPKIILPIIAGANIVLFLAAAVLIGEFGAGLGLSSSAEALADRYSWYQAPTVISGHNIVYLAPTFWTIVLPMLFCGILPLITGLKALITDKKC